MSWNARSLLAVTLVACACVPTPRKLPTGDAEIVAAFDAIEIGVSRDSVEQALGEPSCAWLESLWLAPGQARVVAVYLAEPMPDAFSAPCMLGAIQVIYWQDRVVEKTLHPDLKR